jgi:large subunit ribosomal protein L22
MDETKTARIWGRELRISPKHAVEICSFIKGRKIGTAKTMLVEVTEKKRAVPFRKYKRKVGHKVIEGWFAGRYPVKAGNAFIRLLDELSSNAEYKGLDTSRLKIVSASATGGRIVKGFIPRAFGRASPYNHVTTNVRIIAEEVG